MKQHSRGTKTIILIFKISRMDSAVGMVQPTTELSLAH